MTQLIVRGLSAAALSLAMANGVWAGEAASTNLQPYQQKALQAALGQAPREQAGIKAKRFYLVPDSELAAILAEGRKQGIVPEPALAANTTSTCVIPLHKYPAGDSLDKTMALPSGPGSGGTIQRFPAPPSCSDSH